MVGLIGRFIIYLAVALLRLGFFAICPISAVIQLVAASSKHLKRHSWSCKPNRNMSLYRMLVVSQDYPHRVSCFCTLLYHSSTLDPACLNDLRRSYLTLSSLTCGLQKSSYFYHNFFY